MMKHVILEGDLGERYGSTWNMKAKSYSDIFDCIEANYTGFRKDVIEKVHSGSDFTIQAGEDFITEKNLKEPLNSDTIIITEVPAGAKSGGAKILIGAALLAAVFFLPVLPAALGTTAAAAGTATAGAATAGAAGGVTLAAAASAAGAGSAAAFASNALIGIGLNLVLFGLQQMLAPDPSVDDNEENYLFDAPESTVVSGQPVPYLFGRKIIPGVVISASVIVGALPANRGYYSHPGIIPGAGSGSGGGGSGNGGHIDFASTFNSNAPNILEQLRSLPGVYGDLI